MVNTLRPTKLSYTAYNPLTPTGDSPTRSHLTSLSAAFSPSHYRSTHPTPSLTALALANTLSTSLPQPTTPLYNPYANDPSARQLSEPVSAFLARLPPLTTQFSTAGPWIWIASPYTPHRPTSADWASLTAVGEELLSAYTAQKIAIETSMAGRPKGIITRKLTPHRKTLEASLLATAKEKGCTTGKWMLFPPSDDVTTIWRTVAEGTARGELGIAAKVATDDGKGDRVPRLICVYTADFSDRGDVRTVLERLAEMGLVGGRGDSGVERLVYYKCGELRDFFKPGGLWLTIGWKDAYTHLGINSVNEWGLKASLYSSKEAMAWTKD